MTIGPADLPEGMSGASRPLSGTVVFAPRRGSPCPDYGAEAMHRCALAHPHVGRSHACSCGATAALGVDETVTLEQRAELRDAIEADA